MRVSKLYSLFTAAAAGAIYSEDVTVFKFTIESGRMVSFEDIYTS